MFTQALQQFVAELSISEQFKQQLIGAKTLNAYVFYVELPQFLAPLFPHVRLPQLEELTIHSYLYFSFIIGIDKLVDSPATQQGALQARHLFEVMSLQETAVHGLTRLFPDGSPFWVHFDECKQRYMAANLEEKKYAELRPALTVQQFEELAAGKSAICFAMAYAMSCLGENSAPVDEVLACLAGIHIGSQYFDDIEDFVQDWEQNQYTYAHSEVSAWLMEHNIDPDQVPVSLQQKYLYTSGVALRLMELGCQHYQRSLDLATSLGLEQLVAYLKPRIATYCQQMSRVQHTVDQARMQVEHASMTDDTVVA